MTFSRSTIAACLTALLLAPTSAFCASFTTVFDSAALTAGSGNQTHSLTCPAGYYAMGGGVNEESGAYNHITLNSVATTSSGGTAASPVAIPPLAITVSMPNSPGLGSTGWQWSFYVNVTHTYAFYVTCISP